MSTKTVYSYDDKGVYVGETQAFESPLETGVYHIPANATETAPPKYGQHQIPVFSNGTWNTVPDYRGFTYYLSDGTEHTIDKIDVSPPSGFLKTLPNSVKLQKAKDLQIGIVKGACTNFINKGFTTNINNASVNITLSTNDQTNLTRNSAVILGVTSQAKQWASGQSFAPNSVIEVNGEYYFTPSGGTTGSTQPTFPTALDVKVQDGTITWNLFGVLIGTSGGSIRIGYKEFFPIYSEFSSFMDSNIGKCNTLITQINNAKTVSDVQKIVWS